MIIRDRLSRWLPVLVLALVAAVSAWLQYQTERELHTKRQHTQGAVDYFVDQFTLTRSNTRGEILATLNARRLYRLVTDERSYVEAPRAIRYRAQQSPLIVSSDHAQIGNHQSDVFFQGNVLVNQAAYGDKPALSAQTKNLMAIADLDVLYTREPVVVRQGKSVLTGEGLTWDNTHRHLTIHAKVKATYVKPHR